MPKPNILFLFTDDQRADTVRALGNPHISTPNLDKLARSGLVFRNAYCLGGTMPAVCTPSRNMLLSGRSMFRYERYAPGDQPNLADSLKDAGYFTYHHGKQSNSAVEIQKKFDVNKTVNDQEVRQSANPGGIICDEAIRLIDERPKDKPFFAYLAFETPHDPRVAPKRFLDAYDPGRIPLPANFLPQHPFDNGEMTVRDELLAPWPRTPGEIRRHLREYYAVISALDENIGRLLRKLEERQILGDTLIVFSSDQGLAVGSHGLMGKQNLYQHSMNAPLFFTGPGIPKGETRALVYLMDIYPTLMGYIGAPAPATLDGASFLPALQRKSNTARSRIFLAYRQVQRAIRDERYKLITYPHINRTQLFDLRNDPHEMRDLAPLDGSAARIAWMKEELRLEQARFGDTQPLASSTPARAEWTPPSGDALRELRSRWKM
jgi:arylsulfatase A-like enzyme